MRRLSTSRPSAETAPPTGTRMSPSQQSVRTRDMMRFSASGFSSLLKTTSEKPQASFGRRLRRAGLKCSAELLVVFAIRSNVGSPRPRRKAHACRPDKLAAALAFALKFEGRRPQHDADAFMADIVAKRLVRHLERARFVVMKRPPLGGHSALGQRWQDSWTCLPP